MKKILVLGCGGQIGSELTMRLRSIYGGDNVVGTDIRMPLSDELMQSGPMEVCDACNKSQIEEIVKKYNIDSIFNLVAILSATAEAKPMLGWEIGMGAILNCLEIAREFNCAIFTPSSIGAFGDNSPLDGTPQDTIQRPKTIYGITKVAGELLSDYYFHKYGVDARSVRYPGLISNVTLPGGGTTDYAVEIYYAAVKGEKFICPLPSDMSLDMMYMPDALDAAIQLMEADPKRLVHRNSFNITAMHFTPEDIYASIKKYIPEFEMVYEVDPVKAKIASTWPNWMDDSCARQEWDFNPSFDLDSMTQDMIKVLREKFSK